MIRPPRITSLSWPIGPPPASSRGQTPIQAHASTSTSAAEGQAGHRDGRPGRAVVAEGGDVGLVHHGVVGDVGEEHRGLHHVGRAMAPSAAKGLAGWPPPGSPGRRRRRRPGCRRPAPTWPEHMSQSPAPHDRRVGTDRSGWPQSTLSSVIGTSLDGWASPGAALGDPRGGGHRGEHGIGPVHRRPPIRRSDRDLDGGRVAGPQDAEGPDGQVLGHRPRRRRRCPRVHTQPSAMWAAPTA